MPVCMHEVKIEGSKKGMLLLRAATRAAIAKEGEKKRWREVKYSHKVKNKYKLNSQTI